MATSEILGLFQTPDQYSAAQDAAMQRQFLQRATLDPFQKASVLGQQAGYSAAQGIGGALGGKDPQLEMISRRNMLLSQLNPNDPKTYAKVAEVAARMGDSQFAVLIAQEGRKAESESALGEYRRAQAKKENRETDPFQKLVESGKYTPASLAEFQVSGKPADLVLYEKPEKPENLRSGEKREAVANELYDNRSFKDLTPKEKAVVNKRLEDEEGRKAEKGAPKTYLPNQPIGVKDWQSFSVDVLSKDPVIKRTTDILSDAPLALEVIRTSTQNDYSAAALPGTMSRLVGKDSSVSNMDIERFARTGGLDDRLAQDAVKFFTGRATDVKKDQAEKFTVALYRGALLSRKKKLETAADEFGYLDSPNYKKALKNIDDQLSQFTLKTKGEPTISRETSPRLSDDDLLNKYAPSGKK